MLKRNFRLRLNTSYHGNDNDINKLDVELYKDHKWERFEPDVLTPGFLLFVYALFSCQLRYMRVNCAERNIVLANSYGELKLVAGHDWDVLEFEVVFNSVLVNGSPGENDVAYIRERMKHCPVTTNLPASVVMHNTLTFE